MFKTYIVHIKGVPLFQGEAQAVMLPGVVGEFEVGADHAPVTSLLKGGAITISAGFAKGQKRFEGFFERQAVKETQDSHGNIFWTLKIQQGLMRFDGTELMAVVEKGIL